MTLKVLREKIKRLSPKKQQELINLEVVIDYSYLNINKI